MPPVLSTARGEGCRRLETRQGAGLALLAVHLPLPDLWGLRLFFECWPGVLPRRTSLLHCPDDLGPVISPSDPPWDRQLSSQAVGTLRVSLETRGRLQRGAALETTLPWHPGWAGWVEMAPLTLTPVLCPQNARSEALLSAAWDGTCLWMVAGGGGWPPT